MDFPKKCNNFDHQKVHTRVLQNIFFKGLHLWICYDLAQGVLTPYQLFPNEVSF
jgi:hypothetical protein